MVAVFDQLLGSNQSKTAGTSLVISPASKTVTVGKTIFVGFSSDDVGSAFGVVDNLGNTYTQVGTTSTNTSAVKTQLWAAPVTVGGSITSITVSWTTNITAKAAVAGEFSNFGAFRVASSTQATGTSASIGVSSTFFNGELWVGVAGVEDPTAGTMTGSIGGTPAQTQFTVGSNGTSGGGAASNIAVTLAYSLIGADGGATTAFMSETTSGSVAASGVRAIYNAVAASLPRSLNINQAVKRAAYY